MSTGQLLILQFAKNTGKQDRKSGSYCHLTSNTSLQIKVDLSESQFHILYNRNGLEQLFSSCASWSLT